jgi:rfaE bifunctional protein kinase chain/domain
MFDGCSSGSLHALLPLLEGARVLVIGDVMLDTYLTGDAHRISPEAPVPVVKVERTRHLLGGAGNVARNIAALTGKVSLVGIVGNDAEGLLLEEMLHDARVDAHLLVCEDRPTTRKTRVLARHQQMIRLAQESSAGIDSGVFERLKNELAGLLPAHEIIVVSDYGKGLVSKELFTALRAGEPADKGRAAGRKILVDPKPLNKAFYRDAFLLTPNTKETGESAGLPVGNREEIIAAGYALRSALGAENVLTTLGEDGMALFDGKGAVIHVSTTARQVFDVTGAGDTVIATVALALAAGCSLLPACILANYAAGIVVEKVGAATASVGELRQALTEVPLEVSVWREPDVRKH